jgi:type II secretory pathway pseudopilin PulG
MAMFIPAAMLAAKVGKSYFGNKAKKKQNDEQRKAEVSALTLQQKQREDARRARVAAAGSLLNGVPSTTAGGGVNTGVGLDPALLAQLGLERTYDFGSAVPDRNKGAGSAMLAGLFGDVGDTLGSMYGGKMGGGGAPAGATYNATEAWNTPGAAYHGGMPQSAPLSMVGSGGEGSGMTMEDLMKLIETNKYNSGAMGGGG